MKYITGMFALNIPCSLGTTGDWHRTSLPWERVEIRESDDSVLKEEGIEKDVFVEELGRNCNVANHIRACVDMLDEGRYSLASGMRYDFFDDDMSFNPVLFDYVYRLKAVKTPREWKAICQVLEKDYMLRWLRFLEEKEDT